LQAAATSLAAGIALDEASSTLLTKLGQLLSWVGQYINIPVSSAVSLRFYFALCRRLRLAWQQESHLMRPAGHLCRSWASCCQRFVWLAHPDHQNTHVSTPVLLCNLHFPGCFLQPDSRHLPSNPTHLWYSFVVSPLCPLQAAASSLAAGIALDDPSTTSLTKLGQLLSEIHLADAVIGLELGPGVMPALDKLTTYMAAKQAEAA
jgi:hypothetical protein